jgi:hypothetical protein
MGRSAGPRWTGFRARLRGLGRFPVATAGIPLRTGARRAYLARHPLGVDVRRRDCHIPLHGLACQGLPPTFPPGILPYWDECVPGKRALLEPLFGMHPNMTHRKRAGVQRVYREDERET